MKNKILLILLLLAGFQFKALATHLTGTELTYKAIAPDSYQVIFKLYRECGSAAYATSTSVLAKAPGCNTGRNITLNLVNQEIKSFGGPAIPIGCNMQTYGTTYSIATYTGVLTFTTAEQTCTDWVLSWETCCRTNIANLNNASTLSLYTEAHLKLLPGLVNSSPQFDTINYNVANAPVNQPILISALAQDADGDSLVYSSVAPLSAENQPITYAPTAFGIGVIVNPNPLPPFNNLPFGQPGANPQVATFPAGVNNYSPSWPLPSFFINWVVGQQINQVQTFFKINPNTGNIAFQPGMYSINGMPGQNRYVITIQVEEYRKINGVATKIGMVRRESFIDVVDGGGNTNPYLSQVEMNLTNLEEGDLITLRPGIPMNLKLAAADLNANDSVLMNTNVSAILPGAVFTKNNLKQPSGTITWTPTANDVREQPYYFNVVLKDNANPIRGYHERTIGVRVSNTGNVTGTKENIIANSGFLAFPNPFAHELHFKLNQQSKAERIIIYNLLGQQIDQISISKAATGEQNIHWQNAGKYAAGTYVAKLISADKTVQTLKFTKL